MEQIWLQIARLAGIELSIDQMARLRTFRDWLGSEAIPAGGLGPDEGNRLDLRHIADALLFLPHLPTTGPVMDIGSGVGLPGLPLAVSLPGTEFVLVDRSGRRVDLMRRAIRVLDLGNVEVLKSDIVNVDGEFESIVTRASLSPEKLHPLMWRLLARGGTGLVAGSWLSEPSIPGFETKEIGSDVLAQPVWILIMQRT